MKKNPKIYLMRHVGVVLIAFIAGVAVGGNFPTWIKITFPTVCTLWLAFYDDFTTHQKIKEAEAK